MMNNRSFTALLTAAVSDWCARQGIDFRGKTVLCAVSGGRDSMALLHVLLHLGTRQGFSVSAAHYNHRLRESAVRDEALVRGWCGKKGIPLVTGSGDVRAYAKETGRSIEDAARTLRYTFLSDAARECGADFIATAHHRQDNAETLLLHLLRGSGLQGLGGIAPVRGKLVRPLLDVCRADIDGYIAENAIPYADDETNEDTVYTRNRLRLELLPLLEAISPGSVNRIAAAASLLRSDEEFLQKTAAALLPDGAAEIPISILNAQEPPIAARLVRMAAQNTGTELTLAQTEAVRNLRSGACLTLGGGVRAVRENNLLRFYRLPDAAKPMKLSIGQQNWGAWRVTVFETAQEIPEDCRTVVLRGDCRDLVIAPWDGTGRLGVENGRRTVKRLLADHGIGAAQRENCPAVYAAGQLAAVFGAGTEFSLRPQCDERKIVIHLENEV